MGYQLRTRWLEWHPMADFTLEDIANREALDAQIACVQREIKARSIQYPYSVRAGRLRQSEADDELATMEAVLLTLQRLRDKLQ